MQRSPHKSLIQSNAHEKFRGGRGFTITELMIVIAILFLLVGLALVAMRAVKKNADRLQSTNALKQMMSAYISYSTEHKGRLMPGYIDLADIGTNSGQIDIKAELKSGHVLNAQDTSSYVWRLAPYLDHNWQVMFTDYRSAGLLTRLEDEYGAGDASGIYGPDVANPPTTLGIASVPSYGLNSLFLGGDSTHGPATGMAPWKVGVTKPLAITRMSDAKSPAKLVVFAPAAWCSGGLDVMGKIDPGTQVRLGYPELRPPMVGLGGGPYTAPDGTLLTRNWSFNGAENLTEVDPAYADAGLPVDRLGDDKIAIGHLDGSVDTQFAKRLAEDMSLWDPRMVSPN